MRILQVHNFYAQYGGECRVVEAERALLEQSGHEVIPIHAHSVNIGGMRLLGKASILARTVFNPAVEADLCAAYDRLRPDVAHVHNVFPMLSPSIYRYLGRLRIPVVQSLHNYRFICPNGTLFHAGQVCEECPRSSSFFPAVHKGCFRESRPLSALYAAAVAVARRELGNVGRFIAISKFIGDKLIQGGIPADKVRICGNFIDQASVPADLGSANGKHFLYLGRLSAEKGIHTLLAALRSVPHVQCIFAGSGPLQAEIEKQLAEPALAHVRRIGFVEGQRKLHLLREAKALVAPSVCYENFPMAIVESLSNGVPVIASRIGGLPELVDDGVNGLLVPAGDAGALAQAMKRLDTDPELTAGLGKNARQLAADRFSASRHLDTLLKIYQEATTDA